MRMLFTVVTTLAVGGFLVAADKPAAKEVTLQGSIVCAKCELGETPKCQTAIQVKDGDKVVTYYLVDKGTKESYHSEVCGGGKKEGTVVGMVSEKGGKKYITPSKVTYAN